MKSKLITKADIILAVVLLVLGIGSPFLLRADADENSRVYVSVDGVVMGKYSLAEDQLLVLTKKGIESSEIPSSKTDLQDWENLDPEVLNLIKIENHSVSVEYANCKGNDCVNMGRISKTGQIIACLPHKLLIYIDSAASDVGPDVVIK